MSVLISDVSWNKREILGSRDFDRNVFDMGSKFSLSQSEFAIASILRITDSAKRRLRNCTSSDHTELVCQLVKYLHDSWYDPFCWSNAFQMGVFSTCYDQISFCCWLFSFHSIKMTLLIREYSSGRLEEWLFSLFQLLRIKCMQISTVSKSFFPHLI